MQGSRCSFSASLLLLRPKTAEQFCDLMAILGGCGGAQIALGGLLLCTAGRYAGLIDKADQLDFERRHLHAQQTRIRVDLAVADRDDAVAATNGAPQIQEPGPDVCQLVRQLRLALGSFGGLALLELGLGKSDQLCCETLKKFSRLPRKPSIWRLKSGYFASISSLFSVVQG